MKMPVMWKSTVRERIVMKCVHLIMRNNATLVYYKFPKKIKIQIHGFVPAAVPKY